MPKDPPHGSPSRDAREAPTPAATPSAKNAQHDSHEAPHGVDELGPTLPAPTPRSAQRGPLAQALGAGTPVDVQRVQYRPDPTVHLASAGKVALSNWTGKVDGVRVSVYRGAQEAKVPAAVRNAMKVTGVDFGTITHAELGLRAPPAQFLLGGNG